MADSFKQFMANAFGGQTAPAMTEEELKQTQTGINPATTMQPFQPTGGAVFVPASQVPIPGDTPVGASPAPQGPVAAPVTAPVAPVPQAPEEFMTLGNGVQIGTGSMIQPEASFQMPSGETQFVYPDQGVGEAFGRPDSARGMSPFIGGAPEPQAPTAMGELSTRNALFEKFGAPTIREITAGDPASIAAQQASESFAAESAAREGRLAQAEAERAAQRDGTSGDGMSFNDARKITQPQRPNETKSEYNDRIRQTQGLADAQKAEEEKQKTIEAGKQPDATKLQKRRADLTEALDAGIITQGQYDDQLKREVLGNPPSGYDTWAQYESTTGIDADGDGKIGGERDSTAETQNSGSTPPTSTATEVKSEEDYNALPSGATYTWNGQTLTKK